MNNNCDALCPLLNLPLLSAAWDKAGHCCLHSEAVEMMHSRSEDNAIEALPEEMDLETENIVIVNPSPGQDFMLYVACGNSGLERIFVGASRNTSSTATIAVPLVASTASLFSSGCRHKTALPWSSARCLTHSACGAPSKGCSQSSHHVC